MGGAVPQLWEKRHSGRLFKVFEKIFCKCASFFLPRLCGEKKSKSDFRTPLAGGPNVRYNTPPIDQRFLNLSESGQIFRISNFCFDTA